MTREEFYARAAEAVQREVAPLTCAALPDAVPALSVQFLGVATAALDAVGAWELREALIDSADRGPLNPCWCADLREAAGGSTGHLDYCLSAKAAIAKAEGR